MTAILAETQVYEALESATIDEIEQIQIPIIQRPALVPIAKWFGCPFCGIHTDRITGHDHLFDCPVCDIYHSIKGPTFGPDCGGLILWLKIHDRTEWL